VYENAVPSQAASMSSREIPALSTASTAERRLPHADDRDPGRAHQSATFAFQK
jgi:hypothetical protein